MNSWTWLCTLLLIMLTYHAIVRTTTSTSTRQRENTRRDATCKDTMLEPKWTLNAHAPSTAGKMPNNIVLMQSQKQKRCGLRLPPISNCAKKCPVPDAHETMRSKWYRDNNPRHVVRGVYLVGGRGQVRQGFERRTGRRRSARRIARRCGQPKGRTKRTLVAGPLLSRWSLAGGDNRRRTFATAHCCCGEA
jgi:hypothetical protein